MFDGWPWPAMLVPGIPKISYNKIHGPLLLLLRLLLLLVPGLFVKTLILLLLLLLVPGLLVFIRVLVVPP